jgi:sugar phosphate isomerase/epimerase
MRKVSYSFINPYKEELIEVKLSVFTVSVPDLTPRELGAAAMAAGIEGIEWRFKGIPMDALQETPSFWRNNYCSIDPERWEEEIPECMDVASTYQLQSVALVPYLNHQDIQSTEQAFQAASRLGASLIRVGVPNYDRSISYGNLYNSAIRYISQVQEYAQHYHVKAVIETHHGTIAPSASLAYRLVQSFDPTHVGVLYDPGNMVYEGFENYRMDLELLGPYLAHVHIKNAIWAPKNHNQKDLFRLGESEWEGVWASIDKGIVPWLEVMRDLHSVGYDGYVGIEDFSGTYDSIQMLEHAANLFRYLKEQL